MRLFLTTALALLFHIAHAQWLPGQMSATGPVVTMNTLQIFSMATKGTTFFAGTSSGVLMSSDSGRTWTCVHPTYLQIRSLLVEGNVILAGTNDGFFRSADGGVTWQNPLPTNHYLITALGKIGNYFFAPLGTAQMIMSNDSGTSWSNLLPAPSAVSALATIGTSIYAATAQNGVYKSADSGTTWTQTNSGLTNLSVTSLINNGSTLYAGTGNGRVFSSADSGQTWVQIFMSNISAAVYSLAADSNDIYAGTLYGGVFHSSDYGATWEQVNSGLGNTYVRALATTKSNVVSGTGGTGTFVAARKKEAQLLFEDSICMGSRSSVRLMLSGTFSMNNVFSVQLSDENGSFSNFKQIASLNLTNQTKPDSIFEFIADSLTPSNNYRARVINLSAFDTFVLPQPLVVRNCCSAFTGSPVVLIDSVILCEREKIMLGAQPFPGALTYEWNGPKGFVSNLRNPVINNAGPSDMGIYRVRALSSLCGASLQSTVHVNVKAAPPAPQIQNGFRQNFVPNEQIKLIIKADNVLAYKWDNGSTDSMIVLSYFSKSQFVLYGKQYRASVMGQNGCWSPETSTAYNLVMQRIAIDKDTVCPSDTVMVTWELAEVYQPMGHGSLPNVSSLHLSDSTGSFATYTNLNFTAYSGNTPFTITFPFATNGFSPGDRYRLRAHGTATEIAFTDYLNILSCGPPVVTITSSDTVCLQDTFRYNIHINASFKGGNQLFVQLSDQYGSFAAPSYIDTISLSGYFNSILQRKFAIPLSFTPGNTYILRVISSNPQDTFMGSDTTVIGGCWLNRVGINNMDSVCMGDTLRYALDLEARFNPGNKLQVELSDQNGNFVFPPYLLDSIAVSGDIDSVLYRTFVLPKFFAQGNNYQIRMTSSSPSGTFTSSRKITIKKCWANTVTVTALDTVCMNDTLTYDLDVEALFNSANQLVVELSDKNGSFVTPYVLDSISVSGYIDSVLHRTFTIPKFFTQGNHYRMRTISRYPMDTFAGQHDITIEKCWANTIAITTPDSVCMNDMLRYELDIEAQFGQLNQLVVQLSDQHGSFAAPQILDTIPVLGDVDFMLQGMFTIPSSFTQGNNYRIRVVGNTPNDTFTGTDPIVIGGCWLNLLSITNPSTVCMEDTLRYELDINGLFNPGNQLFVQLSNPVGSFAAPRYIDTIAISGYIDSVLHGAFIIPKFFKQGTNYLIRIVSDNPNKTFTGNRPLAIEKCWQNTVTIATPDSICMGDEVLEYELDIEAQFNPGNKLLLQLSDHNGNFAAPYALDTIAISGDVDSVLHFAFLIPKFFPSGNNYRTRVVSSGPNNIFISGNDMVIKKCWQNAVGITLPDSVCMNDMLDYELDIEARFEPGNQLMVQLSDQNGGFASAYSLDTIAISGDVDSVLHQAFAIPKFFTPGNNYKIRVISNNPNNTFVGSGNMVIEQCWPNTVTITTRDSVCIGNTLDYELDIEARFEPGNQLMVQLSDPSGGFAAPYFVDTIAISGDVDSVLHDGFVVPPSIASGNNYRVRVISNNPNGTYTGAGNILIRDCSVNLVTISSPDSVCLNDTLRYELDVKGQFDPGNNLTVELSSASGSFSTPYNIGTIVLSGNIDSILHRNFVVPPTFTPGNNYRIRVISDHPNDTFIGTNDILIKNCATGLREASLQTVFVYPNPVKPGSTLHVEIGDGSEQNNNMIIALFNIEGKEIMAKGLDAGNKLVKVDLPVDVSNGVYYLRIVTNEKVLIRKILIE